MAYFEGVKKNFGFGMMRLPESGSERAYPEISQMIDEFLQQGFNYFDTAHGYLGGNSEAAIRECLVKRHPRESFILTDKLTENFFRAEGDIRPFFESQLKACGVDRFDFYLMHAQNHGNYPKFKRCRAYETAFELKREGKIGHVGISFHDTAEYLEKILTENPEIEVVQIQFNYLDYENVAVQSRKCYEVCRKYQKPVIVMEPVKGGSLALLPDDAKRFFDELGTMTPASYAIRFAARFEGIFMVLSGMSSLAQMRDNLSYMRDFRPLDERERETVWKVAAVLKGKKLISCTACRYCTAGCPKKISIPDLFSCMNNKIIHDDWNANVYYNIYTKDAGKASDCIACGRCEQVCPQHLKIRKLLKEAAKKFES